MSEHRKQIDDILTERISVTVLGICNGCGFINQVTVNEEFNYKQWVDRFNFHNYNNQRRISLTNAEIIAHVDLMKLHTVHRNNPANLKGRNFPCGRKTPPEFTRL